MTITVSGAVTLYLQTCTEAKGPDGIICTFHSVHDYSKYPIVHVCELVFVFQLSVLVMITGCVVFSNRIALISQHVNSLYESHILAAGSIGF